MPAAGKSVVRNWFLEIDGQDLSNRVRTIQVEQPIDELDATTMGAPVKQYEPGLGDFSLNVTFINDWGSASVYRTLRSMFVDPDTAVLVRWRPDKNAPSSDGNPESEMMAKLYNLPYGGTVGTLEELQVTFRNAGDAGITVATTGSY